MKQITTAIAITLSMVLSMIARGQQDQKLSAKEATETVNDLVQQFGSIYIFPEAAEKAESKLRDNLKKGVYTKISDGRTLAQKLTTDLGEVLKDKHLTVWYNPRPAQDVKPDSAAQKQGQEAWWHHMSSMNLGFPKAEILEGNIGYLKVLGFGPVDKIGATCSAAISFLANTDAMVIDLRHNMGGEPEAVQYLVSHFFTEDSVHINDIVYRKDNRVEQYWTLPKLNAVRYLNKAVYILTDSTTFSAGEELAYDMQVLKRGIVIGETTGGGANPGIEVALKNGFFAYIPNGRAVNPVTKTNWEGTGVKPDINAKAEEALKTAHVMALQKLVKNTLNPRIKDFFSKSLEKVEKYNGSDPLLSQQ